MLIYLILAFTVLPAVELWLLIEVGTHIGAMNTISIVILTGVVGAFLARMQGMITLNRIQTNLNQGVMPTSEMMDGLMILVGGVVLLTPGLITDTFGFLLLIPWTRALFKLWLARKIETMINRGQIVTISPFGRQGSQGPDDIIDV